jgi:ribulose-phosphate 3-epimerase
MFNTEIIPAIMPQSFDDIREKSSRVAGLVEVVQLDLMDGVFVPEKTWPYISSSSVDDVSDEIGLPTINGLSFEIDLMVDEPEAAALTWARAGARRVIIHIENAHRITECITTCRKEFGNTVEVGIAQNIETPYEAIASHIGSVDFVQCMGISRIGYQGLPFDERVIPKIEDLRALHPELIISVDGGVNFESAPHLIKAGANRLVSGSAIFGSSDIALVIERFKAIA